MAARIAVQGILLLVALAGARADEMIVEDEEASASTGDSGGDAPSGDSPSPPPMPDFDYEEMMRSMGGMGGGMGGMGGMDNPYMQKLRRENPELWEQLGGMNGMGNMYGGAPPKKKPDKPLPEWKKKLKPGQLADFELAAQQFTKGRLMKNTIKDTKAMLANAEYYLKTMERTLERGSKYPKAEKKRIKSMLESGSGRLKPEKREEMEERVNILTTFIRSMLNDRDAWKKHDASLEKKKAAEEPIEETSGEDTQKEEEVVLEESDGDL